MNTSRIGALGALMDEYERAAVDLKAIFSQLSDKKLRFLCQYISFQ